MYYAEFGTDKFLRETYFPDFSYKGTFIEVGAAHPEVISNSKHFRDSGWNVLAIEPNPEFAELHRKEGNKIIECAASFENKDNSYFFIRQDGQDSMSSLKIKDSYLHRAGMKLSDFKFKKIKVNVRTLDNILKENNITNIDILSIDVEGWEIEVLQGYSCELCPAKIIVIENWCDDQNYTDYMNKIGYEIDYKLDINWVFKKISSND